MAVLVDLPVRLDNTYCHNSRGWQQQALWSAGAFQFGIVVDEARRPIVMRRPRGATTWSTFDLSPLLTPEGVTGSDPHCAYSLGVDSLGYVHVSGNAHVSALCYARSTEPYEIGSWANGVLPAGLLTYPRFVPLPDSTLLFVFRRGIGGFGDLMVNRLVEPATGTWGAPTKAVRGTAADREEARSASPYQIVATGAGLGRIHLAWNWVAGGANAARRGYAVGSTHDPTYASSVDGGLTWAWNLPGGQASNAEMVEYSTDLEFIDRIGLGGVAGSGLDVDADGTPHVVFLRKTGGGGEVMTHAHRSADGWVTKTLPYVVEAGNEPAVVAHRGRVYVVFVSAAEEGGGVRMAQLFPAVDPRPEIEICGVPVHAACLTFDRQALKRDGQLHLVVTPSSIGAWTLKGHHKAARREFEDASNWKSQRGWLLVVDLDRVDALGDPGAVPHIEVTARTEVGGRPVDAAEVDDALGSVSDLPFDSLLGLAAIDGRDLDFVRLEPAPGGNRTSELKVCGLGPDGTWRLLGGLDSDDTEARTPWLPLEPGTTHIGVFDCGDSSEGARPRRVTVAFGVLRAGDGS